MMQLLSEEHAPVRMENVRKSFGDNQVLAGIDLLFQRGETTAIVGPNGAGKSTLIKCLLGLVRPDRGRLLIGGLNAQIDASARRHVGYMPQHAEFPGGMTGRDMIRLVEELRQEDRAPDLSLVRTLGLGADLEKPFRTLSGGTRQKVSAVLASMFAPPVYVLDEPTAGLDPVAGAALKDHMAAERARGATTLLTSHVMADLEELADRVVFLLDGRVRFDGTMNELRKQTGRERLERAIATLLEGDAA